MFYIKNRFCFILLTAAICVLLSGHIASAAEVEVPLEPQAIMGEDISVLLISREDLGLLGKRNNHEVSINVPAVKNFIEYVHDQKDGVAAQKFSVDVSIPSAGSVEQNAYAVMHADFLKQGLNTIIVNLDALRQKIRVSYYVLWMPTVFEQDFEIETGQVYSIVIYVDKKDSAKSYVRVDERFDRLPNSGDPIISFVKTFKEMGITLAEDNLSLTFHGVGSNNSKARFWRARLIDTIPASLPPCSGTKCDQNIAEPTVKINSN